MLVVRQDGEAVINMDAIACVELSNSVDGDLMLRSSVDGRKRYLGSFKDKAAAQQVLNNLVVAYDCGDKVFRVPPQKGILDEINP